MHHTFDDASPLACWSWPERPPLLGFFFIAIYFQHARVYSSRILSRAIPRGDRQGSERHAEGLDWLGGQWPRLPVCEVSHFLRLHHASSVRVDKALIDSSTLFDVFRALKKPSAQRAQNTLAKFVAYRLQDGRLTIGGMTVLELFEDLYRCGKPERNCGFSPKRPTQLRGIAASCHGRR